MLTQTVIPVPPPPTTPAPNTTQPKPSIMENAALLVITRKWIPMTKTISSEVIQSTADKKMVSATKKLFNSKELKAIAANQVKADAYISRRSSPVPFKKGNHLIADDLV